MKQGFYFELMTFHEKPNTIGLLVTGAVPPQDDKRLIDFIHQCAKDFTPYMCRMLLKNPKIHIERNNDPDRPKDELFVQYTLPFEVGKKTCDLFKPGTERFILSYFF